MADVEKLLDEIMDLLDGDLENIKQQGRVILEKIDYVLSVDPNNKSALLYKGLLYQSLSDYVNAMKVYEQVLAIAPDDELAKECLKQCKEFYDWDNKKSIDIPDFLKKDEFLSNNNKESLWAKFSCELIVGIKVIILLIILCTAFQSQIFSAIFSGADNKVLKTNSGFEEFFVNSPSEFNNLRKDEIYAYRKAYVKDSLFTTADYEPNEKVFGSIEDYKPWWGSVNCKPLGYDGDNHEFIEGNSKQSIQINNPNALVGLSSPYIPWDRQVGDFCTAEYSNFIPLSIKYNKQNNLIVSEYGVSRKFLNFYVNISGQNKRYPLQLSGLNALDFGYKYVYAFDIKNIEMSYSNNITQNVETFRDYIHVGGSCGYAGGCNNISPMQNDKMITVTGLPAEINLKLWKKQPSNKFKKADMYYRIIFKEI